MMWNFYKKGNHSMEERFGNYQWKLVMGINTMAPRLQAVSYFIFELQQIERRLAIAPSIEICLWVVLAIHFFPKWWQNSLLFNLLDHWPSMFCLKLNFFLNSVYAIKANKADWHKDNRKEYCHHFGERCIVSSKEKQQWWLILEW